MTSGSARCFNLQPNSIALAAVVQFGANALQQASRFFLLEVEIAVAGHAKCRGGKHLISAIHARCIALDQIVQEDEILGVRSDGTGTSRGSVRGTVTTPRIGPDVPLRLRRSSRARHRALFSTRGNGCAGSMVMGVSSGSTSRW